MENSTASARKRITRNYIFCGGGPKNPGVIAREFICLFADIERPRRRAYLAAYVQEGGNTARAIKTAGGGALHTVWLRDDPHYRAAFERAKRVVADAAQRAVLRRARRVRLSDAGLMLRLRYLRRRNR